MLQNRSIYPSTLELLKTLMQYENLQGVFLVGGTALAIQLGHRISVDIYELLKSYSIPEMLKFFSRKYPDIAHFHILKSLTYFDDAESEFDPITLNQTDWETVKQVIEHKVNEFI